jgi:hypothetical protein
LETAPLAPFFFSVSLARIEYGGGLLMNKKLILIAVCSGLYFQYSAVPALAYDPLCDQVKSRAGKARCQCNSDAGGVVRQRPNDRGKSAINWSRPKRPAAVAQVSACMRGKGFPT